MERNHTFSHAGIDRARLKLTWAQLEIITTKAEDFQLIVSGDDESVEELRIENEGGQILVAQPQLGYAKEILPRRRWLQICLRVPAGWHGDVDADTVSGPISARDLTGGDLSLSTISGALNVRNLHGALLWLHTVSGAIAGALLYAGRCNLRSVSGDIALTEVKADTVKLFTVSGDAMLALLPGKVTLDGQSVSGNFVVETEGPVRASLHSLSGQYLLDDTLSTGDGGINITVSSVSGDLAIRKGETK